MLRVGARSILSKLRNSKLINRNVRVNGIYNEDKYKYKHKLVQRREFGDASDLDTLTTFASTIGTTASLLGLGAFVYFRYKISNPNQYLVRTGLFIDDMIISKRGLQYPFQKFQFIDMSPRNYSFNLDAMSSQKMEFILPGVFTIGPRDDNESLVKYCRYLLEDDALEHSKLDEFVKGIIEGETRVLSAQMTIEEIFNDRAIFKEKIIRNVQEELDQFGLQIFNANIKELQDAVGSEYFQFLRQKTRSRAEGQARVDMAEAKKEADIGEKEREAETRKQVAQYEADAVEKENNTRKLIADSNADLAIVQADAERRTQIANIEAEKLASVREAELQREVEQKRIAQETEYLRAKDLSKATVDAESIVRKTEGDKKSIELQADASYYNQLKHAEGIKAVYEAQSDGIKQLLNTFGGDENALIQYLMLDKKLFTELAAKNAEAIQGLNPKITIWNTGSNDNSNVTDTIRNITQSIPPLFDTIYDQTGIKLGGNFIRQDFKPDIIPNNPKPKFRRITDPQ